MDTTQNALYNFSTEVDTFQTDCILLKAETLITFKTAKLISIYWFPILVPIGLVGNTLSFLVMIKPNNRQLSTCIYMAAISMNDNVMMLLALRNWLGTELKVYKRNPIECKVEASSVLLLLQNSAFQILVMTIDKHIAIKWPHKAAIYSTATKAKIIAIAVFCCTVIYNIPNLFATKLVGMLCFGYTAGGFITKVYSWFSFILNGIIPFGLLIYMNFVIIKTIRRSRKLFSNDKSNGTKNIQPVSAGIELRQSTMKNAENQLTIMLLLVTTLFLILLLPTYVRFGYLAFLKPDTPSKYALSTFLMQLTTNCTPQTVASISFSTA